MDEQVEALLKHLEDVLENTPQNRRVLIAVAGIPGSGKTTLSLSIVRMLNMACDLRGEPDIAALIPMDGYHLPRSALDAMPDPMEAHARRGAPFTFDPSKLQDLVTRLRQELNPTVGTISAPSFDHAVKDPVENDIPVLPTQRLVVLEGNYLHLNAPPWSDIAAMMDELWFMNIDFDIARKRLIERHVEAGISDTPEQSAARVDNNDMPNAKYIVENALPPTRVIQNIEMEMA